MTRHGFKELSADNWTEPDRVMSLFGTIKPDGSMSPLTGVDWAERFLQPKLEHYVPEELKKLFDVAKGIAVYGFFFYPLYAVCMGEVYRVLDAATVSKCRQLGVGNLRTFKTRIEWLVARGYIAPADELRWNALRELRNYVSHPNDNMLLPPGEAWHTLHMAAREINSLFAPRRAEFGATQPPLGHCHLQS